METASNPIYRLIPEVLFRHGVVDFVVSPGSRNAPLLLATSAISGAKITQIVDERSAAFYALGLSNTSGRPVCLICTSGSALLNYAPAISEAYYRGVPLIVVSADRPKAWIDQDDSQTIRQDGALLNIVKNSYDIQSIVDKENLWYANRVVNDAYLTACSGRKGPVHINCSVHAPFDEMVDMPDCRLSQHRIIEMIEPNEALDASVIKTLCNRLKSPAKVMIVAGFLSPDRLLNQALSALSKLPNFTVLTETISNLHNESFVSAIDLTLASLTENNRQSARPDIVITLGGALVSRHIKEFLRINRPHEHWHVGQTHTTVDCFQSLTTRVSTSPALFFNQIASVLTTNNAPCDYARMWQVTKNRAKSLLQSYCDKAPWSDLKALGFVIAKIPSRWNVHYSNGTPIRYAQLFGDKSYHRCDCNRGVSGIDGCTSTAIGASAAYPDDVTLLVSGDMSALYDIGAFAIKPISPKFKMIIINNDGGDIFRFIKSTREMPIVGSLLSHTPGLPAREMANGFGFAYYEAGDMDSLRNQFAEFSNQSQKPAMLVIDTRGCNSSEVLRNLFEYIKTK